jgi:hypothetical protein
MHPRIVPPPIAPPPAANDAAPRRDAVPVYDTPETPMAISFVGLSKAEQRAALEGFPGGRRFVLDERAA